MQAGKARGLGFSSEIGQRFLRLREASETVDERGQLVDREDRLAVDFIVIRLLEIVADDVIDHRVEGLSIDRSVPIDPGFVGRRVVEVAGVIVVRPHEVKFHFPAVRGFEESAALVFRETSAHHTSTSRR